MSDYSETNKNANFPPSDDLPFQERFQTALDTPWDAPDRLDKYLEKIEGLETIQLPTLIEKICLDMNTRLCCPKSFSIASIFSFTSAAIAKKVVFFPLQNSDSWYINLNLSSLNIGPPGSNKSAPFNKLKSFSEKISREINEGLSADDDKYQMLFITDTTGAGLIKELIRSSGKSHIARDEFSAVLDALGSSHNSGMRELLIEASDGRSDYALRRVDVTRTAVLKKPLITMTGNIQPAKLDKYFLDSRSALSMNDGLLQRFHLLVLEKPMPTKLSDIPEPEKIYLDLYSLLRQFYMFDMNNYDLPEIDGHPGLRFSLEAQAAFIAWHDHIQLTAADLPEDNFQAYLIKSKEILVKIAGIIHLIKLFSGEDYGYRVSMDTYLTAERLTHFFTHHAKRIFCREISPEMASAVDFMKKFLRGNIRVTDNNHVTLTDAYRSQSGALKNASDALSGARLLERYGYLRIVDPKSGNKSPVLVLHPWLRGEIDPRIKPKIPR